MIANPEISPAEIADLRRAHYNATVQQVHRVHNDLAILRVAPDAQQCGFAPGQYTTLGLGYWERRVAEVQSEEIDADRLRKVVRRAYSYSSPILDDHGQLVSSDSSSYVEFYIVLIRRGEERPPGLTPRLFALRRGDRLQLGKKSTGHYTLDSVQTSDNLLFIATGTGEAPHNAMLAELLTRGHLGRIAVVTCVRQRHDLGYLDVYRKIERRYAQVRYVTLTTREPENVDPAHPKYKPKLYLQEYLSSGQLEEDASFALDSACWQVFLCGNPAMIGAPQRGPDGNGPPPPGGMVHALQARGFTLDLPQQRGNIHFEKYW